MPKKKYHVNFKHLYSHRIRQIFQKPLPSLPLNYTRHAEKARLTDQYGIIPRLKFLPVEHLIFEYTEHDKTRYGVRARLNELFDIVLIVESNRAFDGYTVITTWMQERADNHYTLNLENYYTTKKL